MFRIEVNDAINRITQEFGNLGRANTAAACMRAINRTLEQGRTKVREGIKEQYNIPGRYLNERVNKRNASTALLIGYITTSTKPVPLDAFSPRFETASYSISVSRRGIKRDRTFKRRKRNVAAGVSVEVVRGNRKIIPFAFLLRNGKARVFARGEYNNSGLVLRHKRISNTGNDLPIKPLISVSVHSAVLNDSVLTGVAGIIYTVFERRLLHELNRLTNG